MSACSCRRLLLSARQSTALAPSSTLRAHAVSPPRRALFSTSSSRSEGSDAETLTAIKARLKEAMKSKDTSTTAVLRSLLSEHQYALKSAPTPSSTPRILPQLLQRAVARHLDASAAYANATPTPRPDLASNEQRDAELLRSFLPPQIDEDKLRQLVQAALDEVGKTESQQPQQKNKFRGLVVKRVYTQVDKSTAPGALVAKIVDELIAKQA